MHEPPAGVPGYFQPKKKENPRLSQSFKFYSIGLGRQTIYMHMMTASGWGHVKYPEQELSVLALLNITLLLIPAAVLRTRKIF